MNTRDRFYILGMFFISFTLSIANMIHSIHTRDYIHNLRNRTYDLSVNIESAMRLQNTYHKRLNDDVKELKNYCYPETKAESKRKEFEYTTPFRLRPLSYDNSNRVSL